MPEIYTVNKITYGNFTDRGSKFTGYIHPTDNLDIYRQTLKEYKLNHPKACHVCSAYRINLHNRIDEYASDDGEPSGSAGQPILGVLKKNKLVNVAIYIIRIYGGVNLGIPGLINAYRTISDKTLDYARKIKWIEMAQITINYQYEQAKIIELLISKYDISIDKQEFQSDITAIINLQKDYLEIFKSEICNMSNNSIEVY